MFILNGPRPSAPRGRSITIAPASGRPSDPITVPETRDNRAGTSENAIELTSWPIVAVTVCAWLTSLTPGKYVPGYPVGSVSAFRGPGGKFDRIDARTM